MVFSESIVITAAPESRCASSTPLAVVSLAVRVRLPLSVTMLSLRKIDRPAWRVKAPPPPEVLFAVRAVERVISLFAWRVTAVPALSRSVMLLTPMVLFWLALVEKARGLSQGSLPSLMMSTRPVSDLPSPL